MKRLTQFRFFLWQFSHFKVPMIAYVKPRLMLINEREIVIRVPLNRRTRNHLNSMYFGALAVGADLAGGFHAFYHADLAGCKVSLAFKSFQAQFLQRPESDVHFVCNEGELVKQMILESKTQGHRITQPIKITAYTNYSEAPKEVAHFILELSVRVMNNLQKLPD